MTVPPPSKPVPEALPPSHGSGPALQQRLDRTAKGCFLPDLTWFTGLHRCGTGPSTPQNKALTPGPVPLGRGFSPARADCGYRAPLAPRLARSAPILSPRCWPEQCRRTLDRPLSWADMTVGVVGLGYV